VDVFKNILRQGTSGETTLIRSAEGEEVLQEIPSMSPFIKGANGALILYCHQLFHVIPAGEVGLGSVGGIGRVEG